MAKNFIDRRSAGKGFAYFDNGSRITDKETLGYLKSLRVPPAWKDVRIARSRQARILATGYDKAGRRQYIYHPSFRAKQEKEKFERILRFANALPKMRRATERHLKRAELDKKKVLATIIQLMDRAYFRIGNETYAKENQSYGLTTLRSRHTKVKGDTMIFDFIGKSGQRQFRKITDRQLSRIIRRLDELPGHEIFRYRTEDGSMQDINSGDVNGYIKEIMGEEFSAKDFRTWGGTLLSAAQLAAAKKADSQRERKKIVTACVKNVAKKLGNTPAITRGSYIDPRLVDTYMKGGDLLKIRHSVQKIKADDKLSVDERCVLSLLKKPA